ncbi:hypothetical protein QR680_005942 [Steinernema hermaphroditum]|uniref:RecQ mediated genome instability protein 1 OB-fold domain-containing protein n=1 Tax=Steinernema hermaphroditum TaxID=289476 RepID=A0AA39HW73_9BILA|nr:hypothetical protein QR680_005942 [Steinernema hermaphroditum]
MATLADLRSQGWHIDERKLEELLDGKEDVNLKNFLLDNDMREYGDSVVVTKVDRRAGVLEAGTYVFQMTRQRNVSVPKMNEGSHQSGLYKYTFTDGHNSVSALRFDPVPGLTEKTMPGTKVLLTGPITLEAGLLLIDAKNCRVIGGKVDKLIEKWQMDQHGISRTAAKSGAPKWIPFTKKKNVKANKGSDKAEKETNFKALDVIHKAHARDRSADAMAVDDEFSANRKALIDGLEKDHKKRRFAPNHFYDCEFVMHGPVADLCTVRYTELNKEAVLPIGYLRPA